MKNLLLLFALLLVPAVSSANSCLPFLPAQGEIVSVTLVTMNKNGVASFVESGMAYRTAAIPNTGRGARLVSNSGGSGIENAPQVFSDRDVPNQTPRQHFDVRQADHVTIQITLEQSPQVTVTLATHNNAKATFRATCSAGGVMHGSTSDVDYLLFVKHGVVN
jgi:hypothetical protein